MNNIKNFKNWKNIQNSLLDNANTYIYQYPVTDVDCQKSYYEIHILYCFKNTDILTAKASLFKCTEKKTGKNGIVFERKCILEGQPVFECVNTAANAIKLKQWKKLREDLKVDQLVYDANGTTYKVVKQTNKDTCKSNNTKK